MSKSQNTFSRCHKIDYTFNIFKLNLHLEKLYELIFMRGKK